MGNNWNTNTYIVIDLKRCFSSQEEFEKWSKRTDVGDIIVAQGLDVQQAQEICLQVPLTRHISAAIEEARTDTEVDADIFRMRVGNVLAVRHRYGI